MTSIARENRGLALQLTPLYDLDIRNGAKMVEFAGYAMPVQYDLGVMKEHLHTRLHAGLFDVSHMGQLAVRAHSGSIDEAKRTLEELVPCDLGGLADGCQRYPN
jgi:aminomethyltransferase